MEVIREDKDFVINHPIGGLNEDGTIDMVPVKVRAPVYFFREGILNLSQLGGRTYDLTIYQKGGETTGSFFRGLSSQNIETISGFVEEGEFYVSQSDIRQLRGLRWI